MLDGDDPPRGERLAVADAVDLVEDRDVRIARPQEVGVQGVHPPVGVDGAAGGDERLPRHLPAEDPLALLVRAVAAEDVHLDGLEVQQLEQSVQRISHERRS